MCLSDGDEIVNAQKVKAHIDIYNGDTPSVPRCMKYLKESTSPNNTRLNPSISKGLGSTVSSLSSTSTVSLESASKKLDVVYWEGEGVGHGSCLFNVDAWQQVRRMMQRQEQQMFKEKSL